MAPEVEMEGKSSTVVEVSATGQSNGSASHYPQNMLISCVSNTDDDTFQVKNESEDVEVDITECTKYGDNLFVEAECQNTTENSSSFEYTMSGTENISTLNDVEVESPFIGGDLLAPVSDVYNGALPLRKKMLTDHWRRFIRPIMWRCKRIELQIKEFQSQALKYDRVLAEYDHRKQFEFEELTLEGFESKSRPFSCQSRRNEIMKRKKRKRFEETIDLASYMSCHNLFSYNEYKKAIADGACMNDDCGNLDNKTVNGNDGFGLNEDWPFLKFRDSENSTGKMLLKIELVQSQVRKLKTRIDKVVSENSGKFSSINRLSFLAPCNALTSSDLNGASATKSGTEMPDRSLYITSQHISECNLGDLFMPGSAVSSHEESTIPSYMIGSTSQPLVGDSCETNKDGLQIRNRASDEELQNFERIISQLTEKPQVSTRNLDAIPPLEAPKADLPTRTLLQGQSSSSMSNLRKNKRKWGRKKITLR